MIIPTKFITGKRILTFLAVCTFSIAACQTNHSGNSGLPPHPSNIIATADGINNYKSNARASSALLSKLDSNMDYTPAPVENIRLAPHYNATGVNDAGESKPFQQDARMAYNFALGYAISGQAKYAAKAQSIIDAWAKTLKSLDNKQADDIVNFNLEYMIIGASLVKDAGNWNPNFFDNFLRTVALPSSTQANVNNHGLWGIFMEASIYDWIGDAQGMQRIRSRWMDHLSKSIDSAGMMENEIQRTGTNNWHSGADKGIRGMAYTHYALLPATMAAVIFAEKDMPVWDTPSGKKLAQAFAKAAAWTRHPETFPYYQSNQGKLEGLYSAPYFYILEKIYGNADAEWLIQNNKITGDGFGLAYLYP